MTSILVQAIFSLISDHLPQYAFLINFFLTKSKPNNDIWRRDFRSFNLDYFKNDLAYNMKWDTYYDQGTDVNLNLNYFLNQFENIFNKHAPLKKIGKNKAKLFLFPWINEEIRKGMKTRDKLHSKYSSCKNKELKAILW